MLDILIHLINEVFIMKFHGKNFAFSEVIQKVIEKIVNYIPRKQDADLIKQILKTNSCSKKNLTEKKLTEVLKVAYKYVPFYRQYDFLKNVSKKNCFEMLEKLPLSDKEFIFKNEKNLRHKKMFHEDYQYWSSTGGSTGKPLLFPKSYIPEGEHQIALIEYITGESFADILSKPYGIVSFDGTRPAEEDMKKNIFWDEQSKGIYGNLFFCSFYETEENLKYYVEKLNEAKPVLIRGYSNAILTCAKYINKYHTLKSFPKAVYVTSEYCAKESMLEISQAFNCPVYGQYGLSEAAFFGWTKPNDDIYYLSPIYGYAEILNENGKHVKPGEKGELTATAFGNYVQPFIRYRTGDIVEFGGYENGILKLSGLKGRAKEFVYDDDMTKIPLVGFFDIHYMSIKDKVIQFQLEQKVKGEVICRLIVRDDWKKTDEKEIKELLAKKNIRVSFEYPKEIPLTQSGKMKMIIQNLK